MTQSSLRTETKAARLIAAICAALLVLVAGPWLTLEQHQREGLLILSGFGLAGAVYRISVVHFGTPVLTRPLRVVLLVAGVLCISGTILVQLSVLSPTAGHLLFLLQQIITIVVLARLGWAMLTQRHDDLVTHRARQRTPVTLSIFGLIVVVCFANLLAGLPASPTLAGLQAAAVVLFIGCLVALQPRQRRKQQSEQEDPANPLSEQAKRINQTMRPDLYRQAELDIASLAAQSGLPEEAVRQVLYHELGFERFSHFVDGFRIDEAKSVLEQDLEPSQLSGLGWHLGYASNNDFARAFTACTGQTPGSYKRSHHSARPDRADSSRAQSRS